MPESTEVVRHVPQQLADVAAMSTEELTRMFSIAKALALSKRFPSAQSADEAFAVILLGRDLGMSPTQALTGIYIVEGKPQIAAVSLAGFVRKSGTYDYAVLEHDPEHCKIEFSRSRWATADTGHGTMREVLGVSEFTMAEARSAGLVKDKSGWAKYPRNMLFARAMSNGVKWFCPDLMGGIPIYTEGDVFEGTAEAVGLASGQGDGSEPGWGSTSVEAAAMVEAVIDRAKALGHAGLSDRATLQMTLSGQADEAIAGWCERAGRELDGFQAQEQDTPDGRAADAIAEAFATEPDPPSEAPQTEADHAQVQADLDRALDRLTAEEDAGADDAVLEPLRDEVDRLERLLGHDEPGEGQEAMPL